MFGKRESILFWLMSVVLLIAIFPIMPTFDAWTTTSAPRVSDLDWHELLPQGEYWRPWDVLYSHFIGQHLQLFPYLNHLFIGAVHILNSLLSYGIAKRLNFSEKAARLSLLYFFVCPAMLGVVVDVDSIHQVAALFWGLLSLYVFLSDKKRAVKVAFWLLFVIIGTFAKESCFAFLLITPFVAWGFKKIENKEFFKDIAWAAAIGLLYLVLRLSLDQSEIASEYTDISVSQLTKNVCIFILFHSPVLLVALFNITRLKERAVWVLAACIIFAAGLHLVSIYATMHTYVSLPFAAIIFAVLVSEMKKQKAITIAFVVFSIAVDAYLTKTTYDSGELGRRLAQQAIDKTTLPADSVYTVSVAAGKKGFSTFIVRDYNAFAWGIFSQYLNKYEWPKHLKDTTLYENPSDVALESITKEGRKEGFRTFWIVRNNSIEVLQCE